MTTQFQWIDPSRVIAGAVRACTDNNSAPHLLPLRRACVSVSTNADQRLSWEGAEKARVIGPDASRSAHTRAATLAALLASRCCNSEHLCLLRLSSNVQRPDAHHRRRVKNQHRYCTGTGLEQRSSSYINTRQDRVHCRIILKRDHLAPATAHHTSLRHRSHKT